MIISTVVVSKNHLPNLELTNEHLESSKVYIDPDRYPDRYLPKDLEKGIKFLQRELINLNQMVMPTDHNQHTNTGQIARTSTAANAEQTEFSIVKNGLALNALPPAVLVLPNGDYRWLDGITRGGIFKKLKMKNMIADVYEVDPQYSKKDQEQAQHRFSIRMNANERPASPFTKDDLVRHVCHSFNQGWIKNDYESIKKEIELINKNQFKEHAVNHMIMDARNKTIKQETGTPITETFDEASAKSWLRNKAKVQNNDNNNGIYYQTYAAGYISKSTSAISHNYQLLLKDLEMQNKPAPKEYRVILHPRTLKSGDPEKSWKKSYDDFRTGWERTLGEIGNSFFLDKDKKSITTNSKIILYGGIPACWSLEEDYPMDSIVKFNQGKLKNKLFKDVDSVDDAETFDEYMDAKEEQTFGSSPLFDNMGIEQHLTA